MRRAMVAAVVAAMVLAGPVRAQAQDATSHVLMDMAIRVTPDAMQGQCFLMSGAGSLEVTAQSADTNFDPMVPPPLLYVGPYRTSPAGPGDAPEIQGQPVTPSKTTVTLPVQFPLYCYSLTLTLPSSTPIAIGPERTAQFRFVSLKLTYTPQ
jgi:hypothetical protein